MRAPTIAQAYERCRAARGSSLPKVFNRQIGRDMDYPYEAAFPKRQFAFVFNTNRCIACQTCTMACKSTWTFSRGQEYMWWNNVETKPYGGYPQHWDVKTLSLLGKADPEGRAWENGTFPGKTVFEAAGLLPELASAASSATFPARDEWRSPNIHEDVRAARRASAACSTRARATPPTTTCGSSTCSASATTVATLLASRPALARRFKSLEDGIVLIDQERCRGYRKCMEARPYKKAMFVRRRGRRRSASAVTRVSKGRTLSRRAIPWRCAA
ncbi:MAG: hypothetical protein U0166_09715 [Acidobacteriota bacterium]